MLGHDAMSCDLLPSDAPGPHHQGDIQEVLGGGWDMMIAFPPCTYLASSGARWWAKRQEEQEAALAFVELLMAAPIERIAIENPIGRIGSVIRPPDQIIQPWQHGHGETKSTCLWLKNLPLLQPTRIVSGRTPRVHWVPPSKDRWKIRSATYSGIAAAMAFQWGQHG